MIDAYYHNKPKTWRERVLFKILDLIIEDYEWHERKEIADKIYKILNETEQTDERCG